MFVSSCFVIVIARIADRFKRKSKLILKILAGGSVLFLIVIALIQDHILILPISLVARKFVNVLVNLVKYHRN